MSIEPEEPSRHVPVTEVEPREIVTPQAPYRSDSLPEDGRSNSVIPLPARLRRPPWLGLVGIAMVTVVSGVGLWLWWTAGPPPVKYTTMPVDRGPITAIVTATGTVNPVVLVLVGSQVSGKLAKILAVQAKTSSLGTNRLISILRATTVRVVLGRLGSISLIVGGIGIINILLVPITERTRGIGLRMAFWAKRYE